MKSAESASRRMALMRGDEERVVKAFCAWLEREGWTVRREADWVDVVAERDGRRLYAEAKGRTTSPGLDIDTAYGQLLRRMQDDVDGTSFALVAFEGIVRQALRVPGRVRALLRIAVFSVDEAGVVQRHE